MSEKAQPKVDPGTLPQPTTTTATSKNRRIFKLTSRLLLFIAGVALYTYAVKPQGQQAGHGEQASAVASVPYLGGLADKGLKLATGHNKDKEHRMACAKGDFASWISPKHAEEIFLGVPNNDSARAALRRYTSYAHPAGNGYDYISALHLKNEWEEALGLPLSGANQLVYEAGSNESQDRIRGQHRLGVWVDTYYPILNTPVFASVTLHTDPPFEAELQEDIVSGDPDSVLRDEVPTFHGLSVSGDVTGKYVYAGYGRKRDFDTLADKGIDVNGTIAIVKYGAVFRGLKVKAAQEAGAIGVIIYSDPGDDGVYTTANGDAEYPEGPARQPSSVQRGSTQFISKYPGDPSTPGKPAYKNATRLIGNAGNQPTIPSLPISYKNAIPILKALKGKGIKAEKVYKDWVGGLEFHGVEYWTGPSEVDLHLVNEVNTRVTPNWNTMAVIPGHIDDEVIVVGNHRDAWVLGGADPNSGTASHYEVVRGLGQLVKKGWKPLRTIILASWDGEEYGLVGSTEWAEDFGDYLETNVAAYLNLDVSVSGSNFAGRASPSLALLLKEAAEEALPLNGLSVQSQEGGDWTAWRELKWGPDEDDWESLFPSPTGIGPLGSGSDYTAFLQRYGVASTDMGFSPGPKDPVYHYHSIYDSFHWIDKFADPGFHRHTGIAKTLGLLTLRLADSLILPLNITQYALELETYLAKVEKIAELFDAQDEIDFTPLQKSIDTLIHAAKKTEEEARHLAKKLHKLLPFAHSSHWDHPSLWGSIKTMLGFTTDEETMTVGWPIPKLPDFKKIKKTLEEIHVVNKKIQGFEGGFISEEGIKDREWYKHKGVAPGAWLGYGATTFPALTEALTLFHSTELAQKEADELAELITALAKRLRA